MPRPETLNDVLTLVRRSRLVDESRITSFLESLPGTEDPWNLLSQMAERGLLTRFQASEIASGRDQTFDFGPYRVLDRLGRGGMGHVYLCEHAVIGRKVAVKVLMSSLQSDASARKRFAREARAAASLDHPNVVRVFDVEATLDPPYIVMEYVDGTSWQAAVVRHGPFSAAEAALCGLQAARGLQCVADAGLIHRDIKPANLLIDRAGVVKILDLGIVRVDGEASITLDGGANTMLGTLDYLAPEQALDSSAVDIRADLYALGATLYFLLAGHPPFPDGEVDQKVGRKLTTDAPLVSELRRDVPPGLANVIQRLLAREPADRYSSPAALADALAPWAEKPADFPVRLFASAGETTTAELGRPTDPDADYAATPSCATLRVVRPERITLARRNAGRSAAPDDEGDIDFNSPPTHRIRINESDLFSGAPTGRITPYNLTSTPSRNARRGRVAIGIAGLLFLASLLACAIGYFAFSS